MTRPTGRRGRSVLEDLKARLADEDPDGEVGNDPLMS
jgi:hypothetical protein